MLSVLTRSTAVVRIVYWNATTLPLAPPDTQVTGSVPRLTPGAIVESPVTWIAPSEPGATALRSRADAHGSAAVGRSLAASARGASPRGASPGRTSLGLTSPGLTSTAGGASLPGVASTMSPLSSGAGFPPPLLLHAIARPPARRPAIDQRLEKFTRCLMRFQVSGGVAATTRVMIVAAPTEPSRVAQKHFRGAAVKVLATLR